MKFAPTGIENFSHEEATTTFMQGLAAMWFDATALAPWIEDPTKSKVAGGNVAILRLRQARKAMEQLLPVGI